ncbi:MAG: BCCT family transporter [Pirellulaceae bacterium]
MNNKSSPRIQHLVFWPPFLLMLGAVLLNLIQPQQFQAILTVSNKWVLDHFGWLFVTCALGSLLVCALVSVMPIGSVKIGGHNAIPLMSRWNWFAITICTTIAVGILFWSTTEPINHFHLPPQSLEIQPKSENAFVFSISTLFLHWTFVPYAIYCAASLTFALAHYNLRQSFSIGSTLVPVFGTTAVARIGPIIDGICLYSLVAGMAASLGTGILSISGGINELFGLQRSPTVWFFIAGSIVTTFIASSASGLMKGIRILSDINVKGLFLLLAVVFVLGPTLLILKTLPVAVVDFLTRLPQLAIKEAYFPMDNWAKDWSIFYWAVWIAWTPVTACFLGRIAYGRTVREFIVFNLILPAIFCMFWMTVFGTTALNFETHGAALYEQSLTQGAEAISISVLSGLPMGVILVAYFLLSAFICFVTSADSNTSAMASLSSPTGSGPNAEGSTLVKVVWGILVGATAWTMITFADVEGIRMLSNLGGLPAAFLLMLVLCSLVKLTFSGTRLLNGNGADSTVEEINSEAN